MEFTIGSIIKITLGVMVLVFIVVSLSYVYKHYISPYFSADEEELDLDIHIPELTDEKLAKITAGSPIASISRNGYVFVNNQQTNLYINGKKLMVNNKPGVLRKALFWRRHIQVGSLGYTDKYGVIVVSNDYLDENSLQYTKIKNLVDINFLKKLNNAILLGLRIYKQNE